LCPIKEVPSRDLKQFNIRGMEILVINLDGQFFCLDARCSHAGAPLVEGELRGDVLTCPWHGSQFNVTNGIVLKGPAARPLKIYEHIVNEDIIFIEI
jgi:nitrite reductase/ring-hydroxylating ferredoxin subunit